jgi:hypothetical protein
MKNTLAAVFSKALNGSTLDRAEFSGWVCLPAGPHRSITILKQRANGLPLELRVKGASVNDLVAI